MTNDKSKAEVNHSNKSRSQEVNESLPRIVGIEEAPLFLIDNKYLRRGYRKDFRSISSILRSCFMAHNETMNIWTHLIGALCLLWAMYYLTVTSMAHRSIEDHFKEMFYWKEDFGSYLESVAENLKGCQSVSPSAGHVLGTERVSLQHLSHYLDSVKTQNFDHKFFSIHGAIANQTSAADKPDSEIGKVKGMILRAVACYDTATSRPT